jgi:GNAT superfamily N-acetyltransferase
VRGAARPAIELRPAREDEHVAIDAGVVANDPPSRGHNPMPLGNQLPYLGHLLEHGTILVAELDGRVAGFGASIDIGVAVHLADLFVAPDLHGRGIGGRLLPVLFGDRWPRTTYSSDDPRAMPLYIRAGLRPRWPNLFVHGDARALPPVGGLETVELGVDEVASIERRWSGLDRRRDYGFFVEAMPGGRGFVVRRGRRELAVGSSRQRLHGRGRALDRLVVAPDAEVVPATLAGIGFAADDDGRLAISIGGPHPVLPILIGAGFRLVDRDTFMSSTPGLLDPERTLVQTGIP